MAEVLATYKDIPEEDRRKAKAFFDRGRTVAETGNFDYAIEMYLQGLRVDPESVEAHQALRDISLKRKASGGKGLGMFEGMKLKRPGKDEKENMLNVEKALAYDPGNMDLMLSLAQTALKAGFFDTVMWIGPILLKANAEAKNPEFSKFIALKDIYKQLERWAEATEAAQCAYRLRPDDMELQTEVKNLGAQHTMTSAGYASGKSFRESVRDMDKQQRLLDADKDIRSLDSMTRAIREAEAEWKADPLEPGKIMKYVEALERTEDPEHEGRAIEVLDQAYKKTGQFRFRQRIGKINMTQLRRMERGARAAMEADPKDPELRKSYEEIRREQLEFELKEYQLWTENYPTDSSFRFETAQRLFQLQRFDEAIPIFQHVRTDPKYKVDATLLLGRCFLEAGFVDEAAETLGALIEEYQLRGDPRSKEMYYWQGRALELKKDRDNAIKRYSQVAQWDFNYRDVQARIKRLRSGG